MENYAIAIANEFVNIAKEKKGFTDAPKLTFIRLMKLTYIAHGFIMAMLDQDVYGKKRDKVEAWKYGPVFPSVYYQFNRKKDDEICDYATVIDYRTDDKGNMKNLNFKFVPRLKDERKQIICQAVWNRYSKITTDDLINMLHSEGTPWKDVYEEGKCIVIPDAYTKKYYLDLVNKIMGNA